MAEKGADGFPLRWRGFSLAGVFVLALLSMSVLPLAVGVWKMIRVGEDRLRLKIQEQQIQEAELIAKDFEQRHEAARMSLKALASGLYFLSMSPMDLHERRERIFTAARDTLQRIPWRAIELWTQSGEQFRVERNWVTRLRLEAAWHRGFQETLMNGAYFSFALSKSYLILLLITSLLCST